MGHGALLVLLCIQSACAFYVPSPATKMSVFAGMHVRAHRAVTRHNLLRAQPPWMRPTQALRGAAEPTIVAKNETRGLPNLSQVQQLDALLQILQPFATPTSSSSSAHKVMQEGMTRKHVCVYVYVCVCVCVYVYAYTFMHVRLYMDACKDAFMHTIRCMHARLFVCLHGRLFVHTHIQRALITPSPPLPHPPTSPILLPHLLSLSCNLSLSCACECSLSLQVGKQHSQ